MKRQILRLSVVVAASTGLLTLVASAAEAFRVTANHSEPVR